MPDRKAPQANKSQALWKLIAVKASLDGKSEPAALVSTPEGMKAAPAFEAKGKVNVFEQLSEAKKQLLVRSPTSIIENMRSSVSLRGSELPSFRASSMGMRKSPGVGDDESRNGLPHALRKLAHAIAP